MYPDRNLLPVEGRVCEFVKLRADGVFQTVLTAIEAKRSQTLLGIQAALVALQTERGPDVPPEMQAQISALAVEQDSLELRRQILADASSPLKPLAEALLAHQNADSEYWDAAYDYLRKAEAGIVLLTLRIGFRAAFEHAASLFAKSQEDGSPWLQAIAELSEPNTADMIDQRNRTHRLLLIATEQALSGKALLACGTVVKGIDQARNDRDTQAGLMVLGFLADIIGFTDMPEALNCWRQGVDFLFFKTGGSFYGKSTLDRT